MRHLIKFVVLLFLPRNFIQFLIIQLASHRYGTISCVHASNTGNVLASHWNVELDISIIIAFYFLLCSYGKCYSLILCSQRYISFPKTESDLNY